MTAGASPTERVGRAVLALLLGSLPALVLVAFAMAPFAGEHVASEGPQSAGALGLAMAIMAAGPFVLLAWIAAVLVAWRRPALRPPGLLVATVIAVPPLVAFVIRFVQHLSRY